MSNNVRELGNLSKEIYKCITDEIDTERVIITEEQLNHIANHHPEAYDSVVKEVQNAIAKPDYIIKDKNKKDTGLVVKRVSIEDSYVYLVLKICTDSKGGRLANSIISGWHISRKRLQNYLRNCTILYKGE